MKKIRIVNKRKFVKSTIKTILLIAIGIIVINRLQEVNGLSWFITIYK